MSIAAGLAQTSSRRKRPADAAFLADLLSLEGRVALITGGRDGIGRAIAVAFARAGASLAVTSRSPHGAGAAGDELRRLGADVLEIRADVRVAEDARRSVSEVVARFGALDILVNNAGVAKRGEALGFAEQSWDEVIATDLKGPFLMAQSAAWQMRDRGGRIINLSSTFARRPYRERAAYAAAKGGLEQLTRVLALEWAPLGVTVNALALTTTPTPSRADLLSDEETVHARIREIPLGRLGTVDDAAAAALYLASRAGEFITGQVLVVDGGFTLG